LETLVPEHFGVRRPQAVMEALYTQELDPQRMLELAPIVFRAARAGDGESRRLIAMLGDEIVATAGAAIRRLRISRRRFDVVLGGGLFRSRDGLLMRRVRDGIEAIAPDASLTRLEAPPVVGAALLALDSIKASAAAKQRLRKELTEERLRRSARG
jgi:N-acetylglucosamine kinase-like BadF-type ATPase